MSIYDSLIPNNTSTPTKLSGTIYDSLISKPKVIPNNTSTPTKLSGTIYDSLISKPKVIPTPTQPNILSSLGTGGAIIQGAISGFQNTPIAPKAFSLTAPGQATMDAFSNAINQGGKNLSDQADIFYSPKSSLLQKGTAVGQDVVGTVNSLFGALLSPLQGLATIPVIGNVVDNVNKIFSAIGEGAGAGAVKMIKDSPLDQSTKDTITPLIHDTVALVAQMVAGKAIDTGYKNISDNSLKIMKTLNDDPAIRQAIQDQHPIGTKVPVTSETPSENNVPITNAEKVNIPVKSESVVTNIEPNTGKAYIPDNKLPVIDYGKTPKDTLPTIQTEPADVNTLPKGMKYEPITPEVTNSTGQSVPAVTTGKSIPNDILPKTTETPIQPKTAPQSTITPETSKVSSTIETPISSETKSPISEAETPKSTSGNKVSGVANNIEAKAIEQKLTQSYPEKAGYDSSTFKEQAQKTADLINSGIDNARAVVRGESPMPEGMKSAALIAGMEDYAKNNPAEAGAIMQELANSHLASTISTGASETSFARMREQDSATGKLNDLRKAKEDVVGEKKISTVKRQVQTEGNKMLLPKEDTYWKKFLDNITC